MDDSYTMDMRLCDDEGNVSEQPHPGPFSGSYLGLLNHLRGLTARARGESAKPITEPFTCTGSAHHAGEHIRCTSPAHERQASAQPTFVVGVPINGWQVSTATASVPTPLTHTVTIES